MIFKPGEETSKAFPCQIIRRLAGGCMAEVYLAGLCNTEHLVAVKGVSRKAHQVKRDILLEEALMLKKLRHEGIPEYYGFFEEEDRLYYIMSYQKGEGMDRLVREKKDTYLTDRQICEVALQICRILAYLHQKGIVHGDLKPSNLLVAEGLVTLLDFGTAEYMDKPKEKYKFQGTLGYAAPECWHREEKRLSPATDIFAFGATLFYLLEGCEPRKYFGNFILSEENAQKKNRWQPVLDKCCAMEASKRYHSAAEMYKDINHIYTTLAI